MSSQREHDVVVCFSGADDTQVESLVRQLSAAGLTASSELVRGYENGWVGVLAPLLVAFECVVVALSYSTAPEMSGTLLDDVDGDDRRRVLVARLDDTAIPPAVADLPGIDLSGITAQDAGASLVAAVAQVAAGDPPAPIPVPAGSSVVEETAETEETAGPPEYAAARTPVEVDSGLTTLRSATVSASGALVATYGRDVLRHVLNVWRLADGAAVREIDLPAAPLAARFSEDGQTIVVAMLNGSSGLASVESWSVGSANDEGRTLYELEQVAGLTLSRDGRWVAFRYPQAGVGLVDLATGLRHELQAGPVQRFALSPSGGRVALSLGGAIEVHAVNASASGVMSTLLASHEVGNPASMDCSDGILAVATAHSISVFPDTGPPTVIARAGTRRVALNRRGTLLAVADSAGLTELLDTRTGEAPVRFPAESPAVRLTFSLDDRLLVTAHNDNRARIWDISDLVPPDPVLAGGFADDQQGQRDQSGRLYDELGARPYARMMAAVIARRDTSLPVSIGLFGEWGAGKTYFMDLISEEVDALQGEAGPYLSNIVQLRFNAWHYSDTNLWASLGAEFFEQLLGEQGDSDQARRQRVSEELRHNRQLVKDLETERNEATKRAGELRVELAETEEHRELLAREWGRLVLAEVVRNEEVNTELSALSKKLGVHEELSDVAGLVRDVASLDSDAQAIRAILRRRRWWKTWLLAAIVPVTLLVAVVAGGLAARWLGAGAIAALAAALGTVGRAAARARDAIGPINQAADLTVRVEQQARQTEAERQQPLVRSLSDAEGRVSVLQKRIDDTVAAAAELDRELTDLHPGRRLYRFLAERAHSSDYRSQLGVVSTVRRDFNDLRVLMKERWPTETDVDGRVLEPIDRIVLYIDDLDRCEPQQVVAVLQAVHLLLAMDLFVVVVGVDPRWLLRSLRREYRDVLGPAENGARPGQTGQNGHLGPDDDDERTDLWQSTPQNYLEKIFQVPFVLPAMDQHSFGQLIQGLAAPVSAGRAAELANGHGTSEASRSQEGTDPAADDSAADGSAPDDTVLGPADGSGDPEGPRPRSRRTAGALEFERGSVARPGGIRAAPPDVDMTAGEINLLSAMHELVRTPRAAKRLLNIYRMLRSTQALWPGRSFLGTGTRPGEYEAVIQLLAIMTAYPEELGVIMWGHGADGTPVSSALCRQPIASDWPTFVRGLEPVLTPAPPELTPAVAPAPGPPAGVIGNQVADQLDPAAAERWRNLTGMLLRAERSVTLRELEPYRQWAPKVARFSFVLSRFAEDEPDPEALLPAR